VWSAYLGIGGLATPRLGYFMEGYKRGIYLDYYTLIHVSFSYAASKKNEDSWGERDYTTFVTVKS